MTINIKHCHACAEEIKAAAKICKHCGTSQLVSNSTKKAHNWSDLLSGQSSHPRLGDSAERIDEAPRFPRKKKTALLLAIFLGSISYVYTWRTNLGKFLIWFLATSGISVSYTIEMHDNQATAKCLEYFDPPYCMDHSTNFTFTFLFWLAFIVERIWVSIDVADKTETYYENHPLP